MQLYPCLRRLTVRRIRKEDADTCLYNNTAETERLLTENYERYYRLAFKLMRNQDDALDVVQESAYRAIKDCKGVRNKDYLSTWIYRIVVNTSLDMLRRKKKETPTEEMPETPTEDHYQDLDLKQMIKRLDDKSRTVIILRYFEDLKLEDIADIVGENLNTVKARLYRTLEKNLKAGTGANALGRKPEPFFRKEPCS